MNETYTQNTDGSAQGTFLALLATSDERNKYLRELLHEHDCEITFTKIDGSVRIMPCTLRPNVLPTRKSIKRHDDLLYKYNPDVLSVWCVDKSCWRSFVVMNVNNVKVL